MKVSLILTVLNEGQHVRRLFDSILAQTRRPDEVVVCDGGSRDDTPTALESYAGHLPLKIIRRPGANISQGRNAAIAAASGEIIAATDAGVRLDAHWLEALVSVWAKGGPADEQYAWVAGFFRPDPANTFELALGATTLPDVNEIDPARFLPSSRSVAFLRRAWEAVGGYPEWLDFSEDVVFDLKLREKFGPFVFAPEAMVHFRPRPSLGAFARQYFNYARGDGHANLWPRIHFVRYFTYLVAAPLGLYAALTVSPWIWVLGVVAGLAYVRRPVLRLIHGSAGRPGATRLAAMLWIPVIRITGDVAKMVGYPVGLGQRMLATRAG